MGSSLHDSNSMSSKNLLETARVIAGGAAARKPLASPQQQQNIQVQLTQALQRSLRIDELVQTFMAHAREVLSIDGFQYQHPQLDLGVESNKQAMHKVGYDLTLQKENLGSISFSRGKPFVEEELAALEGLLSTLVYPMRNAFAYLKAIQAANTDALTQCGNRLALDEALQREIDLARRYSDPFSLVMFDVDHFKTINDSHGHAAGDKLLKKISETVRQHLRVTDLLFRYGGDEFVVLMHRTSAKAAKMVADKIRTAIEELSLENNDAKLAASLSMGVSEFNDDDSINTLCERTDTALYSAKALGRNQVIVA